MLGPENEPQPDSCLLVSPELGGQTSVKDDWIVGAPELVAEVALTTESIDLHAKKREYQKCGVKEYVVVALRQRKVYWFVNRDVELVEIQPGDEGIYRSEVFPGLWLDPDTLWADDVDRRIAVLDKGLATPERAGFVARLVTRGGRAV